MPEVQVNLSHVPGLDEAGLEVVMKYLYMDDLILEGLLPPDPSGHLPGIPTAELLTQLKKLEVVLEVSKALGLERLFSLAAWHCRQVGGRYMVYSWSQQSSSCVLRGVDMILLHTPFA